MKILVTGSKGQLGRCLQDVSKNYKDWDFVFSDRDSLDITNKDLVFENFKNNSYDFCINCAAYTAVDKAEEEKEVAFLVNAEAVKCLAEACKKLNCTLLHISTDFVFDGTKATPYTETDIPNPINVYGASKLKGEQYVQELLEKYFIIRTSWVYSEYGNNFVKTMLRLGSERDEISVVDNQFGSPTYARNLAEVIIKIISGGLSDFRVYHYSNEGVAGWYDFAKAIFDDSGTTIKLFPINSDAYPTPAKRPTFSVMDKSRIKQTLNLVIPYWRDSLKECLLKIKEV